MGRWKNREQSNIESQGAEEAEKAVEEGARMEGSNGPMAKAEEEQERGSKARLGDGGKKGEEVVNREVSKKEKASLAGEEFCTDLVNRHLSSMRRMHLYKRAFIRRALGHWQLFVKAKRKMVHKKAKYLESMLETQGLTINPSNQRITQVGHSKEWRLTKEMEKQIHEESKKGPCLSILLQYLEYLLRIQDSYERMEKRYENIH